MYVFILIYIVFNSEKRQNQVCNKLCLNGENEKSFFFLNLAVYIGVLIQY